MISSLRQLQHRVALTAALYTVMFSYRDGSFPNSALNVTLYQALHYTSTSTLCCGGNVICVCMLRHHGDITSCFHNVMLAVIDVYSSS